MSALRAAVQEAGEKLSYDQLARLAFIMQFIASDDDGVDLSLSACELMIEALERKK